MKENFEKLKTLLLGLVTLPISLYVVFCKYLSAYLMNGGKNEEQIIAINKEKEQKNRFAVKFPEAEIRTVQVMLLAFGFVFAFGSSIYAFNYANKKTETMALASLEIEEDFEVEAPQTEQVKPPPPPPPPPPEIEVVEDEKILEEEPEIQDTEIEDDEVIEVPEEIIEEEVVEQEIFTVVEDMPKFKGCEGMKGEAAIQCTNGKLQEYLYKVDYPQIAVDNDIEGKVYISFVVGKDGKVEDVTLLRGADKLIDNAALKHVKNMPKFASPGKQRGKAVKVKYSVPMIFKLG